MGLHKKSIMLHAQSWSPELTDWLCSDLTEGERDCDKLLGLRLLQGSGDERADSDLDNDLERDKDRRVRFTFGDKLLLLLLL